MVRAGQMVVQRAIRRGQITARLRQERTGQQYDRLVVTVEDPGQVAAALA
jgi:hypothetical protein